MVAVEALPENTERQLPLTKPLHRRMELPEEAAAVLAAVVLAAVVAVSVEVVEVVEVCSKPQDDLKMIVPTIDKQWQSKWTFNGPSDHKTVNLTVDSQILIIFFSCRRFGIFWLTVIMKLQYPRLMGPQAEDQVKTMAPPVEAAVAGHRANTEPRVAGAVVSEASAPEAALLAGLWLSLRTKDDFIPFLIDYQMIKIYI